MPKCQKCGAAMATVLKREGGHVQTYYECPSCEGQGESPEKEPRDTKEETEDGVWRCGLGDGGHHYGLRGEVQSPGDAGCATAGLL